uniref:Uncharacterized protein n=1 Tax=Sphaerodactylus townsendi TaxID=933632 RepID=A0ACB8FFH4_9SAUR
MIKTVEINGEKVKLQIWDTAGQEIQVHHAELLHGVITLILTYLHNARKSRSDASEWLREIESNMPAIRSLPP